MSEETQSLDDETTTEKLQEVIKKLDMSPKNLSDNVFCVPLLPPPLQSPIISSKKPTQIHSRSADPSPPVLEYTPPEWSCKPPPALGEDKLDEEGFCDHYYLEVIKTGTALNNTQLTKPFISFGRLDSCDVLCEHPSLSRYHTILQYSDGSIDTKFPKGFYAYDLNSTHGTFINKKRIQGRTYVPLNIESILKFGLSTRLYILHGPKPTNNADDLKINVSHEEMKKIKQRHDLLAMKLRARKEVEEEEIAEKKKQSEAENGVNWGMHDSDEDESEEGEKSDVNPFAVIEEINEDYYASDPKKALRVYFEREGENLEYDIEDLSSGKFKCSIRLPISNKSGGAVYAEVTHDGKKKECVAMCALEACRILDSEGVLRQSRQESQRKKKEKDWEEADYYDSDEDNFLDRTGSVEKKRLRRMAQAGKLDEKTTKSLPGLLKNKIHTFDSILSDLQVLLVEKNNIEVKLEKCKAVFKAVQDDDLDSYIESLKVGTIDTVSRAKFKRRLIEIKMEISKLEKLMKVAKTKDFDTQKWIKDFEAKLTNETMQINLIEKPVVIDKKSAEPSMKVEIIKEREIDPRISEHEEIEEEAKTISTTNLTEQVEAKKEIKKQKMHEKTRPNFESLAKKQKVENSQKEHEEDYKTSDDYAVWLPPKDQTGDGKTKLNEKYGY